VVTESHKKQIFEEWLASHKALLFKVVRAYAADASDRDDLFQEIIIQVWRSISSFRQESSVTTWLYRIALNTSIKWIKRERPYSQNEKIDAIENLLVERTVEDDRLAWLYEEIHQLDEIDRSIALLLLDGFTYKEIATVLGITETNVGVKINRIKKTLINKSKNYERV
jgi:RNA polymerase sigma-70 factor (ECF subfamily)